jgi:hypothetical protein
MRTLVLALVALPCIACGDDGDSNGPQSAPLVCSSNVSLSGGFEHQGRLEYDCSGPFVGPATAEHVTVVVRLAESADAHLELRLFGLDARTSPGTKLGAGVVLTAGVPPDRQWEAGMNRTGGCQATIREQRRVEDRVLLSAELEACEPLVSSDGTQPEVRVERLLLVSPYEPI